VRTLGVVMVLVLVLGVGLVGARAWRGGGRRVDWAARLLAEGAGGTGAADAAGAAAREALGEGRDWGALQMLIASASDCTAGQHR
jgi:hypothetical protein